mmetsp:Transcript_25771/g.36120  ORF Transcript_25771/g.36120 Transcript_25771/m.36120 type:complete len:453 (-) Transcript_25771:584-1942(-)
MHTVMKTIGPCRRRKCFFCLIIVHFIHGLGEASSRSPSISKNERCQRLVSQQSNLAFVPQIDHRVFTPGCAENFKRRGKRSEKYAISSDSISDAPRPGSLEAARLETGKVPYGEESRQYRRTVFLRNADWARHRNPDRLFINLGGIFLSGVARQLAKGVLTVTSIALTTVLWNGLLAKWEPLSSRSFLSKYCTMRLPAQPFSFCASALGLLLVFRTNSSYQRWLEAQNNIARISSQLRNILRTSSTWLPSGQDSNRALKDIGLACWAVLRSLQNHLRSPEVEEASFVVHVQKTLNSDMAENLIRSKDRPFWAIQDLSAAIDKLPIDGAKRREIDKSIVIILDCIESCTKTLRYPVPLVYSRHTTRFLSAWLLMLPLAMYDSFASSWNNILLVPATALISFFFLGIDELAIQLEEPFSILPLEYCCALTKQRAKQVVAWHEVNAGNGRDNDSA